MYDLQVPRVVKWLTKISAQRVLVQAPDGIKPYLGELLDAIEDAGVEALVSLGHCWGGCDIAIDEARRLHADCIVHVGHHGPVRCKPPPHPPVLFVPAYCDVDVTEALLSELVDVLKSLPAPVSLTATIQHVRKLPDVRSWLVDKGINVVVESGIENSPPGLITGCNVSSATPDAKTHVVIAGGCFHALGVFIARGNPVVSVDPFEEKISVITHEDKMLKRLIAKRLYSLSVLIDADEVDVIVSTKIGQMRMSAAMKAKRALVATGRKSRVLVVDDVTREYLVNMGVSKGYINTACPRLSIDDASLFPAPVVNYSELSYVLGNAKLEEYRVSEALKEW